MSIAAITSINEIDGVSGLRPTVRYGVEPPPLPIPSPINLKESSRVNGISGIDNGIGKLDKFYSNEYSALIQDFKSLQAGTMMSTASLSKLQMRLISYQVNHIVAAGAVSSLNQSMKKLLET